MTKHEQAFRVVFPRARIEKQRGHDHKTYYLVRKTFDATMYSGSGKTPAAAWKDALNNLDTLAVQLDRLALAYKTKREIECFEKPIHTLVERIGLIKGVEQSVIDLAKVRAMKLVPRSLDIWEPKNGRFYAYIVKVCGGALAGQIHDSRKAEQNKQ